MKYRDPGTGEFKELYTKAADTLPVGTEVDYDGDEVPAGWEQIDDPNIYSTEETFTGKYWIDGKKIYRKVINNIAILPPDDSSVTTVKDTVISMDLSNKQIINISGALDGQAVFLPIPYPHNSDLEGDTDFVQTFARYQTNEIILRIGKDRSEYIGYLIIEYTKTTD